MSSKTFNLSLPEELVKKLDKQAKKDFSSRSEYIRRAVLNQMRLDSELDAFFDRTNAMGKEMGITSEQQVYDIIQEYKEERKAAGAKSRY